MSMATALRQSLVRQQQQQQQQQQHQQHQHPQAHKDMHQEQKQEQEEEEEEDEETAAANDALTTAVLEVEEAAAAAARRASEHAIDIKNAKEPILPIWLKFVDVSCSVQIKASTLCCGNSRAACVHKQILHGVSGEVAPGQILAMMGPSGSGKTSLINLLAGRTQISYSGTITYNDMGYTKALKRRMGFVTQDDVLFIHLTVKETLRYAALLRLPRDLSKQQKIDRADSIIVELGLEKCKDTIIGGPFERGVSGGERKRVCIGQEILIDPSIIFLDEPTSGLDSTTALRILQLLHGLATVGRTVVTTIHQPSSRLYHMFDKLILLSEGHTIYFGKGDEALAYFSSIGFSSNFLMNPADFLLDLANGNVSDISIPLDLDSSLKTSGQSPQATVQQYLVESFETHQPTLSVSPIGTNVNTAFPEKREWVSTWWQQFSVLASRGFKERRHEYLSWLRVFQVLLSATIAGLIWWQSKADNEKNLQDQVGLVFFIAIYWAYFPIFIAIYTFPQERAMLVKERASDMYRLSSYFMSRILGDIPLNLVLPFFFLVIIYFMAHLKLTAGAFMFTLLSLFLIVITAEGLGLFVGAVMMDTKHATTLASILLLLFMLTGGFFAQGLARFVRWIRYVSYTFYAYRLLMKVQYDEEQIYDCDSQTGCKRIASSKLFHDIQLNNHGVEEISALVIMLVGYRVLAYLALRRISGKH